MVELYLAKVDVAGSNPVSRSIFFWRHSQVVRQGSAKSLSPVRIRVSPPHLLCAGVVELVDTRDLKSLELFARAGSSPASGTIFNPPCAGFFYKILTKKLQIETIFQRIKIDVERFMKRTLFTILLMCLIVLPLEGAFLQYAPSAKSAALSGLSLLDTSASSMFLNPANMQQQFSATSSYIMPFSFNEISYKNIALSYRFGKTTIGLGYQDFGNDIYKEQSFVSAANIRIFTHYWLGVGLRYLNNKTAAFDAQNAYQVDVGFRAEYKNLTFSTSCLNLNFGELDNDPLPQENRTSISYTIAENLHAGFGFVKEFDYPFSFRVGISYYPLRYAGFFSGFHTEPNQFTAGCEFSFMNFKIQYAIETHEYLKSTHYISIQYGK